MGCGFALGLLMLVLQPEVGFAAPWPWMAVFWALQIGIGLAVLQALLKTLTQRFGAGRCPVWLLVLATGVLGSVLLSPLYWLIGEGLMQHGLGFHGQDDDEHDPSSSGWARALVGEYFDIVGPVTAAWSLISLPRLNGLVPPLIRQDDRPPAHGTSRRTDAPVRADPGTPPAPAGAATVPIGVPWRRRLPPELGQDVIAVASELQYLRVWTRRGCALVLGALQEVEVDEGEAGMRVHRSWWVAARHVLRVRSNADSTVCDMSDGGVVPVSRRRKAEVLARFGDAARYRPPAPEDAGSPSAGI